MERLRAALALGLMVMAAGWATPADGQDGSRAAELEARQRARLEAARPAAALDGSPGLHDRYSPYPPAPYPPGLHGWLQGSFPGSSYGYGPYRPYLPGYSYPPNPYDDWLKLWGRGWNDGSERPLYHRFQYRFFPETLPDPTRGGYVTQGEWLAPPGVVPVAPRATGGCALVEIGAADGEVEAVRVALPALGAGTAEALRAVIDARLRRGAGITVRDVEGYVVTFPAGDRITALSVGDCP